MCRKSTSLVFFVLVLGLTTASYGVQIFDFEGGLDGWVPDDVAVTLSNSTIGVVTGSESMKVYDTASGWKKAAKVSILDLYSIYMANTTIEMDVTYDPNDWPSATWAQFILIVNSENGGWKDQGRPDTDDVNPGFTSGWDPVNFPTRQTRHVTWDITDTHAGLAGGPGGWFELFFVTNWGPSGIGAYYIDNVQLTGIPRNEKPANGQMGVQINPTLSWTPLPADDKYDVYFGTDFSTVNDASRAEHDGLLYYSENQEPNYYPESGTLNLDFGQTYYWRVDGVNDTDIFKGVVWHFTTVYGGKNVVIGDWENNMDGWRVVDGSPATTSYSTTGATLNNYALEVNVPGTWYTTVEIPLVTEGLVDEFLANSTFSLDVTWVTSEWTGSGWAQVEHLVINGDGIGWKQIHATDDTSNPGSPGDWDTSSWGASNTRTISWDYSSIDLSGLPENPTNLELIICTNSQDANVYGPYHFDNAQLFDPRHASNPKPADEATDVKDELVLHWTPAIYADKHDVYFGTDYETVNDANRTDDPCGVLVSENQEPNYYPESGTLDLDSDQTYYWRVDEVNGTTIWPGGVWSFTTGHYLVVDDMDSYGDNAAGLPWKPGDAIFYIWRDGWFTDVEEHGNDTGSQVYHWDGTGSGFMESMIVRSSPSSMPFYYENDGDTNSKPTGGANPDNPLQYYSEATASISNLPSQIGQDWTIEDSKALVLWFYGDPNNDANATEQMYVKLDNAKVVYDGDMNDIKQAQWHEWNIDLADFGINLSNVSSISIGFGDEDNTTTPGGAGIVYFDDIRLYPSRCVLSKRSAGFAMADYAPAGDPDGDCKINYRELEIMASEWLSSGAGLTTDLHTDSNIDFVDYAALADVWLDEQLWP